MKEAGLSRERTVSWNVVPGWNGTRMITAAELREGVESLKRLMPLLPRLKTIVFVGQKARKAMPLVEPLGFRGLESAHPSPLVRASHPGVWRAIPSVWAQAR